MAPAGLLLKAIEVANDLCLHELRSRVLAGSSTIPTKQATHCRPQNRLSAIAPDQHMLVIESGVSDLCAVYQALKALLLTEA